MWWMMYIWSREGGGDRAWWVIGSVLLRSPNKGFWPCLGDLPPDMPRRPEIMLKLRGISRRSAILGVDSPQSNNRKGHSNHPPPPRERPSVRHSIAGYVRLPRSTPAPGLMRELHWHCSWAEEPRYTTVLCRVVSCRIVLYRIVSYRIVLFWWKITLYNIAGELISTCQISATDRQQSISFGSILDLAS